MAKKPVDPTSSPAAAAPQKYVPTEDRQEGPFEPHELDSAMEALTRAQKIRSNKHLMTHLSKHASKKVGEIQSIADLRARRQQNQQDNGPDADDMG